MSTRDREELPTVIIPFVPGPNDGCRDIFVYLRPETNGVLTESTMLKVIDHTPSYKAGCTIAYLANIPGEYMRRNRIVEQHYGFKLPFAQLGKRFFTPHMRRSFEDRFQVSLDHAEVLGAYEALEKLELNEQEMIEIWVDEADVYDINCQSIKRIGDVYVVNYDIPALLLKYTAGVDIAVMIFRSNLSTDEFHHLIEDIGSSLRREGIVDARTPLSRAFHYSTGPFEQILDARGHLFDESGKRAPLQSIKFYRYLQKRGIHCREIEKALHFPIMQFKTAEGIVVEDCLYRYTKDDSYETAYRKLTTAVGQHVIDL